MSPGGAWVLRVDGENLVATDSHTGRSVSLTSDGEPLNGYGARPGAASTARTAPQSEETEAPVVVWSPDGRRVAVHRCGHFDRDDIDGRAPSPYVS